MQRNPSKIMVEHTVLCALLALALFRPGAQANEVISIVPGIWTDGSTWDSGEVPGIGDKVRIRTSVTLTNDAGSVVEFRLEHWPGHLVLTNDARLVTLGGTGSEPSAVGVIRPHVMTMYSGELTVNQRFRLGWTESSGVGAQINMYGGTFTVSDWMQMNASNVQFNVYDGDFDAESLLMGAPGARFAMHKGSVTFDGYCAVGWLSQYDGDLPGPDFVQHGGVLTTPNVFIGSPVHWISSVGPGYGEYHLYGGTLSLSTTGLRHWISLAAPNAHDAPAVSNPRAVLIMGNADGTGEIVEQASGRDLLIHAESSAVHSRVEGWGEVKLTGTLRNNARVIANGWGAAADRTLDLSTFGTVARTTHHAASNGWFAVNRAKLQLPDLAFTDANPARAWGDTVTVDASDLVLVNSLHIALDGVTADGSLAIALLAPDRSDVNPPEKTFLVGVWDVDVKGGLAFENAAVTIRYDDALAALSGFEDWPYMLSLFRDSGSGWVALRSAVVDEENHRISVSGLNGFSRLAVGVYAPGGTLFLVR